MLQQGLNLHLIALAALVAMLILANALFKPLFDNPKIVFVGEPLEKNTRLQLRPGEVYSYTYAMNGTSTDISFGIFEGRGCTGIRMLETGNASGICVDEQGLEKNGSDSAYSDPSIVMFKPWMLALEDGWTWNNSMYISYDGGEEFVSETRYRVIRMENFSGRDSFLIEIKSGEGIAEYDWVDSEKRILLKAIGEGYEVGLKD